MKGEVMTAILIDKYMVLYSSACGLTNERNSLKLYITYPAMYNNRITIVVYDSIISLFYIRKMTATLFSPEMLATQDFRAN